MLSKAVLQSALQAQIAVAEAIRELVPQITIDDPPGIEITQLC